MTPAQIKLLLETARAVDSMLFWSGRQDEAVGISKLRYEVESELDMEALLDRGELLYVAKCDLEGCEEVGKNVRLTIKGHQGHYCACEKHLKELLSVEALLDRGELSYVDSNQKINEGIKELGWTATNEKK